MFVVHVERVFVVGASAAAHHEVVVQGEGPVRGHHARPGRLEDHGVAQLEHGVRGAYEG